MTRPAFGTCQTCAAWKPVSHPDSTSRACALWPEWRITPASHGCFQHVPTEKPE